MAAFINTNTASLNAQRNLNSSQGALATSLQRLSSGLRINSAKDDAAGLAISERMTSQIRGTDQAARNANDGISMAQTAEGDLTQIGTNLQRMRELTVQSSNASNSSSDRAALQNEVNQLRQEIDRVAANSSFNGVKLLDGSFSSQTFQVGANNTSNDKITISSIDSSRSSSLGISYAATVTSGAVTGASTGTNLTINGSAVNASVAGNQNGQTAGSAYAVAQAINSSSTGVTATANATSIVTATAIADNATTDSAVAVAKGDLTINGVSVGAIAGATTGAAKADNVAAAINLVSAASGVTATSAAGKVTLTAADGREITAANGGTNTATVAATGIALSTTQGTIKLDVSGSSSSNTKITIGSTALGFTGATTAGAQGGQALSVIDISTVAGAGTALSAIDSALSAVNTSRANLGAYQNRFASVVTSLQTTSENLSASRSRIQDTDFAHETAQLTRGQILQQAGTAMLAQANSLPNGVLALLRG
ncbi:MAG: flagellin [Massilia sp.]|nr:flagellin [Massilia sp.]